MNSYRRDDRWRVFQFDVTGYVESEKAALLLSIDHLDDPRPWRFFDRADCLNTFEGEPPAHEQRLESHQGDHPNGAAERSVWLI